MSTTPPQLILTLGFAKLPFCSPARGIITNAYSCKPHTMPNFWMDSKVCFFFFQAKGRTFLSRKILTLSRSSEPVYLDNAPQITPNHRTDNGLSVTVMVQIFILSRTISCNLPVAERLLPVLRDSACALQYFTEGS